MVLASRSARVGVVVAVAVAVGVAVWFVGRRDIRGQSGQQASSDTAALGARGLEALASSLGRTVYWVGPRRRIAYEFTDTADRRVYVRYLPSGVAAGTPNPYLTVASYPLAGAYAVTRAAATQRGIVRLPVGGHGVAFYARARPTNAYIAFPGTDVQVEVYNPIGGLRDIVSEVRPVSGRAAAQATVIRSRPVRASASALRALASTRGKPIYWLGAEPGRTMELSRSPDGRVYLRYLPVAVPPGAQAPYLTVATYPLANAIAVTRAAVAKPGTVLIPLAGGAVAFYAKSRPTNVYLAFPGLDEQVELFDPSATVAHALVAKVAPVP
jgi:hypothetical protein